MVLEAIRLYNAGFAPTKMERTQHMPRDSSSLRIAAFMTYCLLACSSCVPVVVGTAVGGTYAVGKDERTVGAIVDDQGIEFKAQKALTDNPDIDKDRHVNVTSYNGIVLLSGEVGSEQQRSLVNAAVSGVDKVRTVHDYLQVGETAGIGARSKDSAITTAIKGRMLATKELDSTRIKVVTEAEVVYLMGVIDSGQADMATEIARTTRGVQKVVRLFELSEPQSGE